MKAEGAAEGVCVLIAAPYGRDAESVRSSFQQRGYDAQICADLTGVAERLDGQTGVVVLTEETLTQDATRLRDRLARQEPWSDIPFILLTSRRSERDRIADHIRQQLGVFTTNAIVLERPLALASLLSATQTALRARLRQFEMRDRIDELDNARRELADNEARLRLATDAAEIGFWDVDPINETLFWPPRVKAMFGISPHVDCTMQHFFEGLHPGDAQHTSEAYAAASDPVIRGLYDVEYRTIGREDGVTRWVAAKGRGIFDDGGRCTRIIGTAIDITSRKAIELELMSLNASLEQRVQARTDSLMETEAALRQSQKMEAVGQLTGGIAHDFNNMLTGVIGALDIMKRRIAAKRFDDLDRFMDAASTSAQRAAGLTARLLAFSRRQSLDQKPIDVNDLMVSLDELLRRTISESVSLRIVRNDMLPRAIADANQLESAILNLAINARDAMPDGGQLTIEAKLAELDEAYVTTRPDIKPGRYVAIVVSDTGVGMTRDILDKVFDPFFTTKPIGQGTGLGLSMVYGFARQSGGQVRIHSQPGLGTAVSLYLPASDDAVVQSPAPAAEGETPAGAGQTVLVVEDDPAVRLLIREVLKELRYVTIEADRGDAAIPLLESSRPIDLMISDVGLPGLNGRQLADVARHHRPDLPILFVTGYAENAAIRAGFLGTRMAMITKPFALDDLGQKISQMLTVR